MYNGWNVVLNDCSDKDEKILLVIFQQIGNYPDELKYQRLNVKNLSNILDNCALSLLLLIKFGFKYAHNKSQLRFIGVEQYMYHRDEIIALLHAKIMGFFLAQAAIRACFRADKETRQTFDSDTPPFGRFRTVEPVLVQNNQVFYTSWENRTMSYKTQTTLCFKEMCNLNSFDDLFDLHFQVKCRFTNKFKTRHMYVFNNQGLLFENINWDGMDIDKLIYDSYRICQRYPQVLAQIEQLCSVFFTTTHKDENKINFFKKCLYFFKYLFENLNKDGQKFYYDLLLALRKHEYLSNKLSNVCVNQIRELMIANKYQSRDNVIEQINSIVKPMTERTEKSKKICKYIKNSILSKNENSVGYVWTCLLCNKKNNYTFDKCNDVCSSCKWNEWNELYSKCPLYFLEKNQSITFGIDPRVKPFYIIYDSGSKPYDCNKYSYIHAMMENNNNLKLSTIVVGYGHTPSFIIFFEKSNPFTLYDLKQLLFEINLFRTRGENKAKMWTFGDVRIYDPNNANILNKLSDDSIIDIVKPCYIDFYTMTIDDKVRKPVEFAKDKFDQGYYHSCCNTDNIKINITNNNINNKNDNKVEDKHCAVMKRVIKPIETSNVTEVFDFEYSSSPNSVRHAKQEMDRFLVDKSQVETGINMLLNLVKEIINNGYETDLLPIIKIVDNDTSINMIDKIVHEYEMKTNTSISNRDNQANGNFGIFSKFNMGLIKELSKVYKIFDHQIFESKMRHTRHKIMGYPLRCVEMLSLMLYCDGECNYDLCKSQRSHTVMKKWPYFHCLLNWAIKTLAPFEIHYEHLYTGICGVSLQINQAMQQARFQTNVSFSTDLNVALQFRGDSGMVIGMNIKRIYNNPLTNFDFDACDVSWISSLAFEKEILCKVGSSIRMYSNLVRKIGNTQWIAFVEDELDHDKAFKSIFGTSID